MRFRKRVLEEMAGKLQQLGLTQCPVCETGALGTDYRPAILHVGGLDAPQDPEANILYMIRVECQVCGHTLLFNSESFSGPDEPVLFVGTREEEARLDEEDGGA